MTNDTPPPRLPGPRYRVSVDGVGYEVTLDSISAQGVAFLVEGQRYEVLVDPLIAFPSTSAPSPAAGVPAAVTASVIPPKGPAATNRGSSASSPKVSSPGVIAPMPGIVVSVAVKEGESVRAGQVVAVIEAMKMETTIKANVEGIIDQIYVTNDDVIETGDLLIEIKVK